MSLFGNHLTRSISKILVDLRLDTCCPRAYTSVKAVNKIFMLARIWSAALVGIDAVKVGVEVDVSGGLPKTNNTRPVSISKCSQYGLESVFLDLT